MSGRASRGELRGGERLTCCTDCPRNERQAELIRKLWAKNERLRQRAEKLSERVETQQGMIDYFRKQTTPPTAEDVAAQIFKEAESG